MDDDMKTTPAGEEMEDEKEEGAAPADGMMGEGSDEDKEETPETPAPGM